MRDGHLEPAPVWSDLATFDGSAWRGVVDCFAAGFPCQPFSTASRGRRVALDLWPTCLRVIQECEPPTVFLENVQRKPINSAGEDLARLGYTVAFDPFDSAEMGSASPRRRWWLLAVAHDASEPALSVDDEVACIPQAGDADWWQRRRESVLGMDVQPAPGLDWAWAIGNGVDPLVAAHAFRTLAARAARTCSR